MSPAAMSEQFGSLTFNEAVMREKLPKDVFRQLMATIDEGKPLDRRLADTIAHGIKEWALEHGVTHYCHWFQPLTGRTAEKHDAFLTLEGDEVVERFSGDQLVQGEPDASSFPSGGIRSTFEARGYTAWDPSSPIFIIKSEKASILAIPSIFLSYTGEALDAKTPLLRSMSAISQSCKEYLALFGREVKWVRPTLGIEQEYFLVPRDLYEQRMDLKLTGRTLVGAPSPKDQQLDDHYFGQVPFGVRDFMDDLDAELIRLGIPAKTRHNEVAPSQFEIACIFQYSSISLDQNQQLMHIINEVAHRHGYEALLHEKPFAGINGNGKHNNWSLADSEGNNLLEPGSNPRENLPFLFMLTAIIQGVHKYEDLIRSSVATPGNDHRLGANEAPPAIVSVFLGEQLSAVVNELRDGNLGEHKGVNDLDSGVDSIFDVAKDTTDRNRTSPFAFTGNKFEFRAVGGGQSVALPQTFINAVVADAVTDMVHKTKAKLDSGLGLEKAVLDVMQDSLKISDPVRFEGDNYSEDWVVEAEKRGLSNYRKTPAALKTWTDGKNVELLKNHKVLTTDELAARYHVELENYSTKLAIEATTLLRILETQVLPAAFDYQSNMAQSVKLAHELKDLVGANEADLKDQAEALRTLVHLVGKQQSTIRDLKLCIEKASSIEDEHEHATFFANEVTESMNAAREVADALEKITDASFWQMPDYTDILHVK